VPPFNPDIKSCPSSHLVNSDPCIVQIAVIQPRQVLLVAVDATIKYLPANNPMPTLLRTAASRAAIASTKTLQMPHVANTAT